MMAIQSKAPVFESSVEFPSRVPYKLLCINPYLFSTWRHVHVDGLRSCDTSAT